MPGYVGDTATFGTGIGSTAATVTLDGGRGLSGLTLSTTGGGSYTLSRSGGDTASTLTLASRARRAGDHFRRRQPLHTVPVTLGSNMDFSGDTGSNLTLSSNISGVGPLMVSGSGTADHQRHE